MSTKLLTGHQSVNHIAAPDDAAVNAALITGENCIIANGKTLAPSIDPATGDVTVGAFVALFSGRKVVSTGDMVTYTTPSSASLYRHVSVGILYEKNTNDDDVESCRLAVFTSELDRNSAASANADNTGAEIYSTSISAETTEAYMELFNFVCTSSVVVTSTEGRKTYNAYPSDTAKRTDTETRLTTLETWKTSKTTSDAAVANRVTALESWESGINTWKTDVNSTLQKTPRLFDLGFFSNVTGVAYKGFVATANATSQETYDYFIITCRIYNGDNNFVSRTTIFAKGFEQEDHAAMPFFESGSPQKIIFPRLRTTPVTGGIQVMANESLQLNHYAVLEMGNSTVALSAVPIKVYGVKI